MADLRIDTENIDQFAAAMAASPKHLKAEMQGAMQRSVLMVERDAKAATPVKTGNLRRSITSTATPTEGKVGTNVPYARAVHDGRGEVRPIRAKVLRWVAPDGTVVFARRSGPTRGKPFLLEPFTRLIPQIRREFQQVPKRVFAKLGGR